MGRGRSTAAASASSTVTTPVKVSVRGPLATERVNEKGQPPPEDSDESSPDSSGRKTRRSLQTVPKEHNVNAIMPSKCESPSNKRSRLRKNCPQINHNLSSNLADSKNMQKIFNFNSSTDELLVVSDGIPMKSSSANYNNELNMNGISAEEIAQVAEDYNVINVIEISDDTDNLSCDTDTATTGSSSAILCSNDTTCSADDEAESSISDESRVRSSSSSILTVADEDSVTMSVVVGGHCSNVNEKPCESVIEKPLPPSTHACNSGESYRSMLPSEEDSSNYPPPTTVNIAATSGGVDPHNRTLSSPEFLNVPKQKIVRTYQNKRKLRADAIKSQDQSVESVTEQTGVQKTEALQLSPEKRDSTKTEKSPASERLEAPECRRSQRQRVIKYEVRDLFQRKGHRNQSDNKNSRSSISSYKAAKDSPRSDLSSSPQTFKGFSDTEDPSSPIHSRRCLFRPANATPPPTISKVVCDTKKNSAMKTPSESHEVIVVQDELANKLSDSQSLTLEATPKKPIKVTKAPLKKEPQKPSRILPRRKTVLLNRSPDGSADTPDTVDKSLENKVSPPQEQIELLTSDVSAADRKDSKSVDGVSSQTSQHSANVIKEPEQATESKITNNTSVSNNSQHETVEDQLSNLFADTRSTSIQCELVKRDEIISPETMYDGLSHDLPTTPITQIVSRDNSPEKDLDLSEILSPQSSKVQEILDHIGSSPSDIAHYELQAHISPIASRTEKLPESSPEVHDVEQKQTCQEHIPHAVELLKVDESPVLIDSRNQGNERTEKLKRKPSKAEALHIVTPSSDTSGSDTPGKSSQAIKQAKVDHSKAILVNDLLQTNQDVNIHCEERFTAENQELNKSPTEKQVSIISKSTTETQVASCSENIVANNIKLVETIESSKAEANSTKPQALSASTKCITTSTKVAAAFEQIPGPPLIRKRGRPPGSKNKPKLPTAGDVIKIKKNKKSSIQNSDKQSEVIENKATDSERPSLENPESMQKNKSALSELEPKSKQKSHEKLKRLKKLKEVARNTEKSLETVKSLDLKVANESLPIAIETPSTKQTDRTASTSFGEKNLLASEKRKDTLQSTEEKKKAESSTEIKTSKTQHEKSMKASSSIPISDEKKKEKKRSINSQNEKSKDSLLINNSLKSGHSANTSTIVEQDSSKDKLVRNKTKRDTCDANVGTKEKSISKITTTFDDPKMAAVKEMQSSNQANKGDAKYTANNRLAEKDKRHEKKVSLKSEKETESISKKSSECGVQEPLCVASKKYICGKSEKRSKKSHENSGETENIRLELDRNNAPSKHQKRLNSASSAKSANSATTDAIAVQDRPKYVEIKKIGTESATKDSERKRISGSKSSDDCNASKQYDPIASLERRKDSMSSAKKSHPVKYSKKTDQEDTTKLKDATRLDITSKKQTTVAQSDPSNSFSQSANNVTSSFKPDSNQISANQNRRLSLTKELKLQTSSKMPKEFEDVKTTQAQKPRCFSKALSMSDGISDACSSDSNESKFRLSNEVVNSTKNESFDNNSVRNAKSSDSEFTEDKKDASLASNLSSVLNGLSKASMNDLLEWTCNNKQTVMQIKDTIDQSQKPNPVLKSEENTEAFFAATNIPSETKEIKKTAIVDELKVIEQIEASQSKMSSESISKADVPALDEPIIKPGEKVETISSVIQTSKEMLAELMSSSFDEEVDSCPEAGRKKTYDSDHADQNSQDGSTSTRRRSDRIKTQTKLIVGRGLVRDRSDRNQNSAIALNLEAQNAKFLKDMEERLSQFQMIKENEYRCERVITREAKRMTCDCFLTRDEEDRGEFGCGEDCLNRLLMIECSSTCNVGDRCTNRRFQYNQYAPCKVFRTEKKGFGIMADAEIESGEFIMEYVGEVLNGKQFEKRAALYSEDKNKHYYFMALRGDSIIDATMKGNISRFINHSCDPNAETQKWTVNGELRIGFFSKRIIRPGEEITFDYQFQRYGKEAQKCYCESATCRGWIGEEPDSEDEEDELTSSESEDEAEVKSPDDMMAGKDRIIEPKTLDFEQPHAPSLDSLDLEKPQEVAISDETALERSDEGLLSIPPVDKKAEKEKEKSARRAQKAAEKFAKISAKLKAKKEREKLKQSNLAIEDRDIEAQIVSLENIGLKNQPLTLQLNRCMVRVKSLPSKERLLNILQNGEMACRRLFLDYHGLRLLHGWMSEIETADVKLDLRFRHRILLTLEILPIPNKTILKDSKVFQVVDNWYIEMNRSLMSECPSDNDDDNSRSPPSKKLKADENDHHALRKTIRDLCDKLTSEWEVLPEVFRIPKRERIEQMKEHEREADRQYKALNLGDEDQYHNQLRNKERFGAKKCSFKWVREKFEKRKDSLVKEVILKSAEAKLTKLQRRQLFAAKVAKDEAEKRLAEERREFEFKCKFYGFDPRFVTPNNMPFYVHPSTGQWYSKEKKEIPTPPSHAHIKVPPKPQSSDPKDYTMPEMDLPPMWKFAMDPRGRLYYYHIKIRIPQWEPPIKILPLTSDTISDAGLLAEEPTSSQPSTSTCINEPQPGTSKQAVSATSGEATCTDTDETDSDISCSEIIGIKKGVPLKIGKEMLDELKRSRKRKRFNRLVQERTISPRREEDRIYNQLEMRRYRENKEKIRRRKEEIKRRKAQMKRETESDPIASTSALPSTSSPQTSGDNMSIPIQDYLLSSDEDDLEKAEYDNSLIEKIVHGDNIVDELDAIAKEKPLKRALPILKEHSESKKRIKLDDKKQSESTKSLSSDKPTKTRKPESASSKNSRRAREKFRSDIAGIIVHHLTPYRRDSCSVGRITTNEDFKHLARKLTHFVLLKELKHCDTTGQVLIVTESVKNKSREFIKKYMAKYGDVYVRPANDPEFRDIPH